MKKKISMLKYFFVELEKLKPLLLSGRSRVMTGNRAHMTTSLLHLLLNLVRTTSTFRFSILQFVYVFSCPGQLNRWPCQSVTHWLTDWLLILSPSEYRRAVVTVDKSKCLHIIWIFIESIRFSESSSVLRSYIARIVLCKITFLLAENEDEFY